MLRPVLAAVLLITPVAAQAEEGGISGLFGNTVRVGDGANSGWKDYYFYENGTYKSFGGQRERGNWQIEGDQFCMKTNNETAWNCSPELIGKKAGDRWETEFFLPVKGNKQVRVYSSQK